MMTGLIARAWQTVKPHVPLIKFRKGGSAGHSAKATSVVTSSPAAPSGSKGAGGRPAQVQLPVIEDWQLPPRYRRHTLDEKEIDAINSGGAY